MKKIWGKKVLLPDGWSDNTLIEIDAKGKIKNIKKNVNPSYDTFDTLIPSPMNLHSHCFQRAMSGLSENDVLERYYQAAKYYSPKVVVRISGDCPLIDPNLVDEIIGQ